MHIKTFTYHSCLQLVVVLHWRFQCAQLLLKWTACCLQMQSEALYFAQVQSLATSHCLQQAFPHPPQAYSAAHKPNSLLQTCRSLKDKLKWSEPEAHIGSRSEHNDRSWRSALTSTRDCSSALTSVASCKRNTQSIHFKEISANAAFTPRM